MKYSLLVAWREYAENIKTKGFWIGILLFPTILMLMIQVPVWLEKKGTPVRHFVLVDQSGQFEHVIEAQLAKDHQRRVIEALREYAFQFAQLDADGAAGSVTELAKSSAPSSNVKENIQRIFDRSANQSIPAPVLVEQLRPFLSPKAPPFEAPRLRFQRIALPPSIRHDQPIGQIAEQLKPYLNGAQKLPANRENVSLYAAVLIPTNVTTHAATRDSQSRPLGQRIEYWSANLADQILRTEIEQSVQRDIRRREYLRRGLNVGVIDEIEQTRVLLAAFNPKKEKGEETVGRADVIRQWAPAGFVYLLWVAIFSIAQMLLNNMIEEKSNRVIEVLLSSVTAAELMMGKLAGIAAIGLTMVGAWLSALASILLWKSGGQSEVATQLFSILRTSNLIPAFIVYFVLGYIMYAGLILAIGSMCNTLKEAQNYMAVITMIMIVPLMTMTFIPRDPNGTLATVLSWIPLYTPFVMMNRATADPPLRDLIGTVLLLVIFTIFVLWTSVRVFRVGILRTGQPPRLLELWRWIKSS